jgi:hypothetical protein
MPPISICSYPFQIYRLMDSNPSLSAIQPVLQPDLHNTLPWAKQRHAKTTYIHGRAIAQAVSRWLPGFKPGSSHVGICGGQSGAGAAFFSPSTSVSPANLHSTNFSTITIAYHPGLLQQAGSDRSTQSPTAEKKKRPYKIHTYIRTNMYIDILHINMQPLQHPHYPSRYQGQPETSAWILRASEWCWRV